MRTATHTTHPGLSVDQPMPWEKIAARDRVNPWLMGVVNVNADSFSTPREAPAEPNDHTAQCVAEAVGLTEAGAEIVDVGAESASPATPVVEASAEADALLPVLEGLHRIGMLTSVDTYKPSVAGQCIAAGAAVVNDYSGLSHPELAGVCAERGARLVLTHNPAGAKNKVLNPDGYRDLIGEMMAWFEAKLKVIEQHGLDTGQVLLDPGIDLAKTPAQSIEVLRKVETLAAFGLPLLVAISRKDFIGAVTSSQPVDRDPGTLAAIGHLIGVPQVIARVHDISAATQYLAIADVLAERTPVSPTLSLATPLRRQQSSVPLTVEENA